MRTLKRHWNRLATVIGAGVASVILFTALWVWGQTPQPVLTIAPLGDNQYSIVITNSVTNAAYVLCWTPVLNDANYPWQPINTNSGETSWEVDGGGWASSYFCVILGTDWDGDGVPNYMDADPNNASLGALTVTIDSPINGSNLY